MTDPPRAPLDVPACVSEHLEGAAPLRVRPRAPRPPAREAVSDVVRTVDGVRVLDPTEPALPRGRCARA